MSELEKLMRAAFIVSASDEGGRYLGNMSAKVALSELAAKDREIAALREALKQARKSLAWFDDQYCHGGRQPTYLYAKIDAALSAAPAPDPAEVAPFTEASFVESKDGGVTWVTPAPDPAEAMRDEDRATEICVGRAINTGTTDGGTLAREIAAFAAFARAEERKIMRAKCEEIARGYSDIGATAMEVADAIAALKGNGEGK